MAELRHRTWRWFVVRLANLSGESAWSHTMFPADPATGERTRRNAVTILDDPDEVEAFFARQGAG